MSLSEHGPGFVKGSGLDFPKEDPASRSMTRQSFAKDADINTLMKKYPNGGCPLELVIQRDPADAMFGDFSDLVDYPVLVGRINQAQADFMALSSDVRARFDNSVEKLLDFIARPENVVESVKMKLLPASMIDATFLVRPDLATEEWKAIQAKKGAAPEVTPTPPAAAS